MIYVVMLCYISSGNCSVGRGDPVFSYFNTLAACERMAQTHNQGHLRTVIDMRAVCFEKPGWQPVRRTPAIEEEYQKELKR